MLNVGQWARVLNLISSCISQPAARPAPGQTAPEAYCWEFCLGILVQLSLGRIQRVQQMSIWIQVCPGRVLTHQNYISYCPGELSRMGIVWLLASAMIFSRRPAPLIGDILILHLDSRARRIMHFPNYKKLQKMNRWIRWLFLKINNSLSQLLAFFWMEAHLDGSLASLVTSNLSLYHQRWGRALGLSQP